ncbi:DUF397 domain-containing protein [Kibdelosporangium philippinense]|uniref:DUF397 domain-containing protein n=1 Tax=Kibdelosporangium philippinense TaxID=211113 RepID=A0ABS8Z2J4_9PSEU|nr:DUF397 domain-containing protein [Kibdelosporangium philippinense]MCE7002153.1 DUF397 domain-containing protein [Kibdelosporangium philippinense]
MINQETVIPKDTTWRKASRSVGQGACVEVGLFPGHAATRDSKNASGPALVFGEGEWTVFLESVKRGPFS